MDFGKYNISQHVHVKFKVPDNMMDQSGCNTMKSQYELKYTMIENFIDSFVSYRKPSAQHTVKKSIKDTHSVIIYPNTSQQCRRDAINR